MSNKEILDNYKRLNLVQLAKDLYGYKVDTKGSYSQSDSDLELVYKHYTSLKMYQSVFVGNNENQENVIFVRKNRYGEYFYTNVTSPNDQGTVIDFIANRNQFDLNSQQDLAEIERMIASYSGEPAPLGTLPVYRPVKQHLNDRNALVARYFRLLPELNQPEYLLARGIEKGVLDADIFKGKISNSVFKDRKGNQQVNIAFPLVDVEDNLLGIEYNNVSFSGLQGEGGGLIWRSNLVYPESNVEAFVIGRAAIDLISYAQIKELTGKNVLFISHPGELQKSQIHAIQYLIDQHSPEKIILAEGNDTEGYHDDIILMGALSKPFKGLAIPENDLKAELVVDKGNVLLTLNIAFADFKSGKLMVDKMIADFTEFNQDPSRPVFKTGPEAVTYGRYSASLTVKYHLSARNMRKASEIVERHRNMQDFIIIDKPDGFSLNGSQLVSWNEFLMTDKKIHVNDIPALMYKFKIEIAGENDGMKSNVFKPEELVQLFIENWDKGINEVQEAAVEAGVSIDVISHAIAKHQLIAFNNYIEAVQRAYDLDFVGFKEFEEFKEFIANNEERYREIMITIKSELQSLESELMVVKRQLRIEGDELGIDEYQKLAEKMASLEDAVKAGKKSLGTHNEYLDAKYYNELNEIVAAKAKKVWDKTVREAIADWQTIYM